MIPSENYFNPSLPTSPEYKTTVQGKDLSPGDVIISNQAYGTISHITDSYIYTSTGKRLFYPEHFYPTFEFSS